MIPAAWVGKPFARYEPRSVQFSASYRNAYPWITVGWTYPANYLERIPPVVRLASPDGREFAEVWPADCTPLKSRK